MFFEGSNMRSGSQTSYGKFVSVKLVVRFEGEREFVNAKMLAQGFRMKLV